MFILGDDVKILNDGGYKWKTISDLEYSDNIIKENFPLGVDISHNQSSTASRDILMGNKAEFAILRVTIGSSAVDKNFKTFYSDFKGKLKLGYYSINYFCDVSDAESEADYIIDTLKSYDITQTDLPIFADWEELSYNWNIKQGRTITAAQLREMVVAFCDRIILKGYTAGIYCNKNFYDNWYGKEFFDQHPQYWVWLSDPSYDEPQRPCQIHQYASNSGLEYGYSEKLDKDRLHAGYLSGNSGDGEESTDILPIIDSIEDTNNPKMSFLSIFLRLIKALFNL